MNTDITDIKNANGWVGFDAECSLCVNLARRFMPRLDRHGFALLPLQTPWVKSRLAVGKEDLLTEMRLITPQGRIHGGADALTEIARHVWWAKPVYWFSRVPLAKVPLSKAYRWVACNRNCIYGSCSVPAVAKSSSARILAWIAAPVPAVLAVTLGRTLPGWVWMWVIALSLFFGAKQVTIQRFLCSGKGAGSGRLLAYGLLWPGMDLQAFCGKGPVLPPAGSEWAGGIAKMLFGAAVVWVGVPLIGTTHPIIAGWLGMIGIVLLLHFGLFHLLSVVWRALGINARPIMRSPARATSLSGFWGESWNAAFTDLMHGSVFKPLTALVGPRGALFLVFLISGLLHELVISIPATNVVFIYLPVVYLLAAGKGAKP